MSAAHVVIRGRARPWGTLGVHTTRPRSFGADDIGFLQSVANVLALAVERHELEALQRREREILHAIFDNIPVMISFYDASGRPLRVNREWERVLGWTLEEAQRVDVLAEAYPDPKVRHEVLEFIRRAERRWADFRPRTRDGRIIDASWMRCRLSDGSAIGFGLDITERKRAEEARAGLFASETRARAEAEAALERLRAIESITDSALRHLGLDDLLRELLARLQRALDTDASTVFLLNEDDQTLYPRAAEGYEGVPGIRVRVGYGVTGLIAAKGEPLIVDDYSTIDVSGIEGIAESDLRSTRSVMGVPLRIGDKVVGVVVVSSLRPRRFTAEELRLMGLVADRVAPTIELGRLVERVRDGRARQKALARRLLTAQEEERRRLAVELHDELGQVLTAAKINLESLERVEGAAPSSPHLRDAIASVDRAMARVHDLALDLRPSVLDDLGLPAALRWYVDRLARAARLEAHLSIDAVPSLEPELQTGCFRVMQEALTNVARHARAQHVWVDVHLVPKGLELQVRDDGIGFDVTSARERAIGGASMGLLGMQERVSLVGGEFEIDSLPGEGTKVSARFAAGERGHRT
jgi:PAS domain S-box-containing protein